ncbi:hypothetical protein [Nostoc sp. DedQUE09]|uniref:hypothetical protein n=1 Tax=Nostoc sp. DedQUE09 TaxID=3075394 RepID=UPI002AD26841|nr:hypothetical protein [Nostoc sp. DedQUE09]MDZ7950743.1 hypothetical protein [Nostoc sp. DedQUE09]
MTYQIYSQQQLQLKSIARLKQIYSEIACTVEVSDKRCKDAWISAIVNYQASKIQKVTLAAPDNQALAQAELDSYIADQAQVVAPEPLRIVEISFDHHEYYAGNQLIASISNDDNHLTQPWVVMVNDKEVFRANTLMRCDRFICTHYKDGTLPVKAFVQGSRGAEGKNLQQLSPLPLCTSAPMPSSSTENQIMAHIFNECQNYNNSQFASRNSQLNAITKSEKPYTCNNSITNYVHNCELRTANCELLSNWWVKRRYSVQQQYSNSVLDAVRSLSMVDVSTDGKSIFEEYFLDQPLEQLTGDKLQRLLEKAELVTA